MGSGERGSGGSVVWGGGEMGRGGERRIILLVPLSPLSPCLPCPPLSPSPPRLLATGPRV
ncbi:hypothetical protein PI95_007270 [Hassallia byssoidea VB512170]|uniref:Uncharacterized protein n=1 Tax=Hassallia byssoidea VB512170 TaxID=1304833 RepID=A0A846H6Z7_9CYAN|nr:hypothetical protein [Hassalia byssoidea]NEU72379.1 hypothetical protein [Hassalia byssoidea VB512170]